MRNNYGVGVTDQVRGVGEKSEGSLCGDGIRAGVYKVSLSVRDGYSLTNHLRDISIPLRRAKFPCKTTSSSCLL